MFNLLSRKDPQKVDNLVGANVSQVRSSDQIVTERLKKPRKDQSNTVHETSAIEALMVIHQP